MKGVMPQPCLCLCAILALLFRSTLGQGTPFACCYADGHMEYGFCNAPRVGVQSWTQFKSCWSHASKHFSNSTVVGDYNLTMAEKYNIFVIVLDKNAKKIQADLGGVPLTFDADVIAAGAQPELGYLPFELRVQLPSGDTPADPCPKFELDNVAINITLHQQRPREKGRKYAGFTFGISGCGRESQVVSNLSFHALGYGNLELGFLTLRDSSDIMSIEPPTDSDINGPADDAISIQESDIVNCTIHYFGDVTGQQGNTYGWSQNGSRSIQSRFIVADPRQYIPDYSYRSSGDGYSFSWYGSYPQEWNNSRRDFLHLDATEVHYIRDIQLGSVNVSNSVFWPWLDISNPVFTGSGSRPSANPPSIELYNMESAIKHKRLRRNKFIPPSKLKDDRLTYGCNVSDSKFYYIWDVDVLASAVSRSFFYWSADGMNIPATWTGKVVNPSFWVNLQSDSPTAGFVRAVNDTLVCMRPSIEVNKTMVPAQAPTIVNGSLVFGSKFAHTSDPVCKKLSRSRETTQENDVLVV
mmetsp:Transcript_7230/g.11621  ORF Transcript_7230/g.11621 Transcript_7230/m.11621 type:complete len:524 (-) Transcript_7230:35-1606(-)